MTRIRDRGRRKGPSHGGPREMRDPFHGPAWDHLRQAVFGGAVSGGKTAAIRKAMEECTDRVVDLSLDRLRNRMKNEPLHSPSYYIHKYLLGVRPPREPTWSTHQSPACASTSSCGTPAPADT